MKFNVGDKVKFKEESMYRNFVPDFNTDGGNKGALIKHGTQVVHKSYFLKGAIVIGFWREDVTVEYVDEKAQKVSLNFSPKDLELMEPVYIPPKDLNKMLASINGLLEAIRR